MRRERRLRTLVPTAPGPAAAGQGANERDGMDLEEAFLRGMTQTDASADAAVSWDVEFTILKKNPETWLTFSSLRVG